MKIDEEPFNNKFSNCVFIKLHTKPQSNKLPLFFLKKKTFELQLTYRFGEHCHFDSVTNTHVTFAITEGILVLDCRNVTFPEEERGFPRPFSVQYTFHREAELIHTEKRSWNFDVKTLLIKPLEILSLLIKPLEILFKWNQEKTRSNKDGYTYDYSGYQAYAEGTEERPVVRFVSESLISSFLQGDDKKAKIGMAKISSEPWEIKFYFKINHDFIKITKFKGKNLNELGFTERFKLHSVRQNLLREIGDTLSHGRISSN